jgi:hypothetical protein
MAMVTALQAAGLSYAGAWQLAQAQIVASESDRRRLSEVLAAVLAPRKPVTPAPVNASAVRTRGGILVSFDD